MRRHGPPRRTPGLTAAALDGPAGTALRGLLAEALPDLDGVRGMRSHSPGRNRQLMAEVLRRAAERGEIPPEAVTPVRLEVGSALLRSHFLFGNQPLDEQVLVAVVDDVLLPMFSTRPYRLP